ncbi:MAG: site-2 protease family protein [Phycisphaerae bacterium]
MNWLDSTFRVGRIGGINLHIHMLFLFWIGYQFLTAGDVAGTAAFMTVLFTIVILHELGHCYGARAVGGDARDILIWPLGGIAFAGAPMRAWEQFVTVAAGPAVNVAICIVTGLILVSGGGEVSISPFGGALRAADAGVVQIWAQRFYNVSLALFYFNMLPIFPMDGGQLLRTALWPFIGLRSSTMICGQLGVVGAILLAVWGFQGGNIIMVMIALFGGMEAFKHYMLAKQGYLVDESFGTPGGVGRVQNRRSLWSRWFGRREGGVERAAEHNPNPGGWERKQTELERLDRDVDRILQKVHEHGTDALSYSERTTLERASKLRKERDVHGGRV